MTPQRVADALGIAPHTVRQAMRRMVEDDQLGTDGDGRYFLPLSLSHLSPVSLIPPEGDSGDSSDSHSLPLRLVGEDQ